MTTADLFPETTSNCFLSFVELEHVHISVIMQSISIGLAKPEAPKHISMNLLPSSPIL